VLEMRKQPFLLQIYAANSVFRATFMHSIISLSKLVRPAVAIGARIVQR